MKLNLKPKSMCRFHPSFKTAGVCWTIADLRRHLDYKEAAEDFKIELYVGDKTYQIKAASISIVEKKLCLTV